MRPSVCRALAPSSTPLTFQRPVSVRSGLPTGSISSGQDAPVVPLICPIRLTLNTSIAMPVPLLPAGGPARIDPQIAVDAFLLGHRSNQELAQRAMSLAAAAIV